MTLAMRCLADQAHPSYPVTIYYAFKQSETRGDLGTTGTGWETFLDAVICSGFTVTGTWPIRTERPGRMVGNATNSLASSVVLVCRPRPDDTPLATRREFVDALKSELPDSLRQMQQGNIAPVDLAQASIGPGMAIFTRYSRVLDASGEAVSVREACPLLTRRWMRCWQSRRATWIPILAGPWPGSSSRGLAREITEWPRPSPRPRTPAFPVWWTRALCAPAGARSGCSGPTSFRQPGTRRRTTGVRSGKPPITWCGSTGSRASPPPANCWPSWLRRRIRPRPGLPSLPHLRPEEPLPGGPGLQRPGPQLGRDFRVGQPYRSRASGQSFEGD